MKHARGLDIHRTAECEKHVRFGKKALVGKFVRFYDDSEFRGPLEVGDYAVIGPGVINKKLLAIGEDGCVDGGVIFKTKAIFGDRVCIERKKSSSKGYSVRYVKRGYRCFLNKKNQCVKKKMYVESIHTERIYLTDPLRIECNPQSYVKSTACVVALV